VTQADGLPLQQKAPEVNEAVSLDVARQMMVLLQAVVQHGTAAAAAQMHHALGGKTGTTNNFTDAWFVGFSPSVTCGTWMGFDDRRQSLGEKETGAKAALPMWMDFMKVAVAGKPDEAFAKPNAPKKKLEVQQQPEDALPVAKPPVDDTPEDEDAPKTTVPPRMVTPDAMPQEDVPAPVALPSVRKAPAPPAAVAKPVPPQRPPAV
jgi:penicillin-binding protein 1A